MPLKTAEQELQEFLNTLPKWLQKSLAGEAFTAEEVRNLPADTFVQLENARPRYETLIRKIPAKFREYKNRQEALIKQYVVKGKPGRPPKIEEAITALTLEQSGKSRREIGTQMGDTDPKHGKDRVRKKLKKYGPQWK